MSGLFVNLGDEKNMMGKLSRLFGILFVVFLLLYAVLYFAVINMQIIGISIMMFPVGMAMGAFFILFIVMFVLKR